MIDPTISLRTPTRIHRKPSVCQLSERQLSGGSRLHRVDRVGRLR
jgi:hypothetical protein